MANPAEREALAAALHGRVGVGGVPPTVTIVGVRSPALPGVDVLISW